MAFCLFSLALGLFSMAFCLFSVALWLFSVAIDRLAVMEAGLTRRGVGLMACRVQSMLRLKG